jgi:small redox-active disulfide protein 2
MTKIEILGTGCPKCDATLKNAEQAVSELGVQGEVVKVYELSEITARGVVLTPAVAVDGEIKVVGKVPTVYEFKALLGTDLTCA